MKKAKNRRKFFFHRLEERRLAYVAITRARKKLYLTHAQTRRLFGQPQANPRSRFINEMPKELLESDGIGSRGITGTGWEKRGDRHSTYGSGRGEDMYGGRVYGKGTRVEGSSSSSKPSNGVTSRFAKPAASTVAGNEKFSVGDTVDHKTFGIGQVVAIEGDKLSIYFAKSGQTKKLLKGYAPIVKVN